MSWIFPGSNERSFISCRKCTQNLTLNRPKGQGKRKKLFSNSDGEDFTQHVNDETNISWDTISLQQTPIRPHCSTTVDDHPISPPVLLADTFHDSNIQHQQPTPINSSSSQCRSTPDQLTPLEQNTDVLRNRAGERPVKQRNREKVTNLFADQELENKKKLFEIIPDVFDVLSRTKLLNDFVVFITLIGKGTMPLDNIAFLLALEVGRRYSVDSTNRMWYWPETTLFWRVELKLFHGSFKRFMSGGKLEGQIIENSGTDNSLSPQDSQINFAVPPIEKLRNYRHSVLDSLPAEIQPRIIPQAIDLKQS